MKKITFILIALVAGNAFAQNSESGTADVNAVLVSPISIEKGTNGLDFGSFTKSEVTATVTVDSEGTRTFSQTDMVVSTGNTPTAADFNVTFGDGETYTVSTAVTQNPKNSDSETLTLKDLTTSLSSESGNTASSFTVGGTLEVPTTATADSYTGEISITVTYE